MSKHFSATNLSFYDDEIIPIESLPADCVSVSDEVYEQLMADQDSGKQILANEDGEPYSVTQGCSSCNKTRDQVDLDAHKEVIASSDTLGHVKIGANLSVAEDGTISANPSAVYRLYQITSTDWDLSYPDEDHYFKLMNFIDDTGHPELIKDVLFYDSNGNQVFTANKVMTNGYVSKIVSSAPFSGFIHCLYASDGVGIAGNVAFGNGLNFENNSLSVKLGENLSFGQNGEINSAGGGEESNVSVITTTATYADILSSYNAGKDIVLMRDSTAYNLIGITENCARFSSPLISDDGSYYVDIWQIYNNGNWSREERFIFQSKLTFDLEPTAESINPVTSNGIKSYVTSSLRGYLESTSKGAANGVASLDANGKVPSSQLPSVIPESAYLDETMPLSVAIKVNTISADANSVKGYITYFRVKRDLEVNFQTLMRFMYPYLNPASTNVVLALYWLERYVDNGVDMCKIRLIARTNATTITSQRHTDTVTELFNYNYDEVPTTASENFQITEGTITAPEGEEFFLGIFSDGYLVSAGVASDSDIQQVGMMAAFSLNNIQSLSLLPYEIDVSGVYSGNATYTLRDKSGTTISGVTVQPTDKRNFIQIES